VGDIIFPNYSYLRAEKSDSQISQTSIMSPKSRDALSSAIIHCVDEKLGELKIA